MTGWSSHARAEPVWNNLDFGMTKAEVLAKQPHAHQIKPAFGQVESVLQVDNARIGSCISNVMLEVVKSEGLKFITITPNGDNRTKGDCSRIFFEGLTQKYGSPTTDKPYRTDIGGGRRTFWTTPVTTIEYNLVVIGSSVVFDITYGPKQTTAASEL